HDPRPELVRAVHVLDVEHQMVHGLGRHRPGRDFHGLLLLRGHWVLLLEPVAGGRWRVAGNVPRWMHSVGSAYIAHGGIGTGVDGGPREGWRWVHGADATI